MKPAERDAFISDQLEKLIARVKNGEGPAHDRYPNERAVIERLVPIAVDGFRGITLTAIMGKFVRADIDTSNEFGSINPRPIFEKGIRPVLRHHRIPTGASAPLNVAKNVQVIDEKWAEGRKPEEAALAAVDYIRRINRHWSNESMRDDLIAIFLQRLLSYAAEIAELEVELDALEEVAPLALGRQIAAFAEKFQEAGASPQMLFGILLEEARSTDSEFRSVEGAESSVFGTNTTSRKPADIWEILSSGSAGNLFEVTCKGVDIERLDAAVESFSKQGLPNAPITFVCRIPKDIRKLSLDNGVLEHRGATFQFLDFIETASTMFALLPSPKRERVLVRFNSFIGDPSRTPKTKIAWADWFSNP